MIEFRMQMSRICIRNFCAFYDELYGSAYRHTNGRDIIC